MARETIVQEPTYKDPENYTKNDGPLSRALGRLLLLFHNVDAIIVCLNGQARKAGT